jgi:cysteine synthase B
LNGNRIHAKLEQFNPFSHSVKDRPAAYMLTGPLERGEIRCPQEKIWIEASSGNLGIAYGQIGRYLGLETMIVLPSIVGEPTLTRVRESASHYEVTPDGYCPRGENDGALKRVADIWLSEEGKYEFRDQYSSIDNIRAHEETTGPEIWRQTGGKVTTLVLAPGTGGTIIGSARYLKTKNPDIEIIAVKPERGHHIQGIRNFEDSMKSVIFKDNEDLIDRWIEVEDREALECTIDLWREGCHVGTSSGINYAAARKIAKEGKRRVITTLFPDSDVNSRHIVHEYLNSGG